MSNMARNPSTMGSFSCAGVGKRYHCLVDSDGSDVCQDRLATLAAVESREPSNSHEAMVKTL